MAKWFCGGDGSRSKSSRGLGSWKEGGVLGGENGEGEALVVTESAGTWRRPNRPDSGKKAFPGRLAATGGFLETA